MSLVDDIVGRLNLLRPSYPTRGMTPQQLGSFLNEAVWPLRDQDVGLEGKVGGDVAILPDGTTISHDIIRIGNLGGDFLYDAEGAATVQRPDMLLSTKPFVRPQTPFRVDPAPVPGPEPTPAPDPVPSVPDLDLASLVEPVLAELEAVRVSINGLKASVDTLNKSGIKIHF